MKSSLTKLLLALSLVVNPVAVLAGDFQDVGIQSNQSIEPEPCDATDSQYLHSQLEQHDDTNCEMPCCEGSECTMQHICIVQHHSDFTLHKTLRFNHPNQHLDWDGFVAEVPDRELPPENPPPIDL